MKVRELRREDAPQVMQEMQLNFGEELALQGWDPVHFQGVVERSFGFPAGWVLALLRLAGRPPVYLLVADEAGKVIGTTFVFLQKTHGYIAVVQTDPAWRGKGIATTLLDRAEGSCRRRRRGWAVLDVLVQNITAQQLYRKRGYRPLRVQHWFTCPLTGRGEPFQPAGPSVRPMEKRDLDPLLALYREQQPPPVREILAPEKALLSPPRYLQAIMEASTAAWCTGPVGDPTGYIRATFTTVRESGNLGAPLLAARSTPQERQELLRTALAWLASSGTSQVVTEISDYATAALELVRGAGFQERLTLDTLVLPLSPSPTPA